MCSTYGKHACAYQRFRNISFSEKFAYVLNGCVVWVSRSLEISGKCLGSPVKHLLWNILSKIGNNS